VIPEKQGEFVRKVVYNLVRPKGFSNRIAVSPSDNLVYKAHKMGFIKESQTDLRPPPVADVTSRRASLPVAKSPKGARPNGNVVPSPRAAATGASATPTDGPPTGAPGLKYIDTGATEQESTLGALEVMDYPNVDA
jgi:hypothetical protein